MRKNLFTILMILTLAVSAAGCGGHEEETLPATEADTLPVVIETELEITTPAAEPETQAAETDTGSTENTAAETTGASITKEEAEDLLLKEFGEEDFGEEPAEDDQIEE